MAAFLVGAVLFFHPAVRYALRQLVLERELACDERVLSAGANAAAYAEALGHDFTPVALLKIEKLGLQVPVFMGTSRLTLNRGAGVIDGTAAPGEVGNIGLSGHRDSFFRAPQLLEGQRA